MIQGPDPPSIVVIRARLDAYSVTDYEVARGYMPEVGDEIKIRPIWGIKWFGATVLRIENRIYYLRSLE